MNHPCPLHREILPSKCNTTDYILDRQDYSDKRALKDAAIDITILPSTFFCTNVSLSIQTFFLFFLVLPAYRNLPVWANKTRFFIFRWWLRSSFRKRYVSDYLATFLFARLTIRWNQVCTFLIFKLTQKANTQMLNSVDSVVGAAQSVWSAAGDELKEFRQTITLPLQECSLQISKPFNLKKKFTSKLC